MNTFQAGEKIRLINNFKFFYQPILGVLDGMTLNKEYVVVRDAQDMVLIIDDEKIKRKFLKKGFLRLLNYLRKICYE